MARKSGETADVADRVIDAALALAAEGDWSRVRLSGIAERADVTLAGMRPHFASKRAILEGFAARVDAAVLSSMDAEMALDPPRERLFDVMMARFDALMPHRRAVDSIVRSMERSPAELLDWNPAALRSMSWMLEAAGIDASGRMGCVRAQGLAVAYWRTLRVWLSDDDPGMARTMAALDQRLREGESWLGRLEGVCRVLGALSRGGRRRSRPGAPEAAAPAAEPAP